MPAAWPSRTSSGCRICSLSSGRRARSTASSSASSGAPSRRCASTPTCTTCRCASGRTSLRSSASPTPPRSVASIPDPPGHGDVIAGPEGGGEYAVEAVLREGWGGTIRAGRYLRPGRRGAVRGARAGRAVQPGVVARLAELGRVTAVVRDPHLLGVYDLVHGESGLRLLAEWSDGLPLETTLGPRSPRA